ncbi:MAG: FAD-binding oxidoreductase [Candidatus Kapabacteria bacterium]|nr:FAD-binding oxidoreductase [Candidatus Kapabacteria bacterium]
MKIKKNNDEIESYLRDASNLKGSANAVYLPETVAELQKQIKKLYHSDIPFSIYAAGTGLTGSAVAEKGVVISMELLNSFIEFNADKKYLKVQSGVRLEDIQDFLETQNFFYPPNPTEKLSFIGGNIATNASGARTFKYGMSRNFVRYLKLILANGKMLELRRGQNLATDVNLILYADDGSETALVLPSIKMPNCKNASGYYIKPDMDAIDLFIGSEGTLAAVAEIELSVLPMPDNIMAGIIFFNEFNKMLEFIVQSRDFSNERNKIDINLNDKPCARLIEYFDNNSLEFLKTFYSQIPHDAIGAVWFEQEYYYEFENIILVQWYELITKYSDLADGSWFALNETEHRKFREFRHKLPLTINELTSKNIQTKIATDTAVPMENFEKLFYKIHEILSETGINTCVFGHVGNNHLHANFFVINEDERKVALTAYQKIIDLTLELQGTVSAEHGIGKLKKNYLKQMYGDEAIQAMKAIKRALDPKMLINQGNLFD